MEPPTYADFGKLRLRRFVSRSVRTLKNWEYEEELWLGEACGFTEVLRLERDPTVVRSVAVELTALPMRVQTQLLNVLGLPLRRGMNLRDVSVALGKPRRTWKLVADRTTYEFQIGKQSRYWVTCTLLKKGGLIYVTMMAPTRVTARVAKRNNVVRQPAVKDENAAHPIASAWRPTLRKIVNALACGDYALQRRIPFVAPVSVRTARQMKRYVGEYGETVCDLPEETWSTSVAQWTGSRWDVLVDLWTVESGRSDMVLHVLVSEVKKGFRLKIHLVYVP